MEDANLKIEPIVVTVLMLMPQVDLLLNSLNSLEICHYYVLNGTLNTSIFKCSMYSGPLLMCGKLLLPYIKQKYKL